MRLLGVRVDNMNTEEVLRQVEAFLNDADQYYAVTCNPEFLVEAQKDKSFKRILNQADLSVPDGTGLILASWILRKRLKQRITGVDLMDRICELAHKRQLPVFLLGGKQGAAEEAARKLVQKYPGLQVEVWPEDKIKKPGSSNRRKRGILFVAFGAPRQEKWIAKNIGRIPQVGLAIGVGGTFDFVSGRVKRAPKLLRKMGLEWSWRLMLQPWRAKRAFRAVIVFPILVLKEKLSVKR